jgi:hypothetical protein
MEMTAANRPMSKVILALIAFNALFLISNGMFMLAAPTTWYFLVPGVKETGSFNHFIRDIGIIQVFLGAAFAIGMMRPSLHVGHTRFVDSVFVFGSQLCHHSCVQIRPLAEFDETLDRLQAASGASSATPSGDNQEIRRPSRRSAPGC